MSLRDENGAVIIEATIALSVFMFFIVTILAIVNICYAQAKIGTSLNETAKELSGYSYLYALTGLNEKQAKLHGEADSAKNDIGQAAEGISDLCDAFKDTTNAAGNVAQADPSETIDRVMEDISQGKAAKSQLEDVFSRVADDPKAFMISVGKLLADKGLDDAKSKWIAAPLTKCIMKKHLKSTADGDCETLLKALKVVPGAESYMQGMNFDGSSLFPGDTHTIRLVARYKVKVVPLLPVNFEFTFCQTAETEGWFGG